MKTIEHSAKRVEGLNLLEQRVQERTAELARANQSLRQQVEEGKRATAEMREALSFEMLIAELTARFINVPGDQINHEVATAQREVCEHLGLDASTIWHQSAEDPTAFRLVSVYRSDDSAPLPEAADAHALYPYTLQQALLGTTLRWPSLKDLPAEAARDLETYRDQGTQSVFVLPLACGGGPVFGILAFCSKHGEREWADPLAKRLAIVAQILASALARQRGEQMLRESEARLSLAAESAGAGLWILDLVTNRFWGTRKARELFGLPPGKEVTFESVLQAIHPEDRDTVRDAVQQAIGAERDSSIEFRVRWRDGSERWISSRGRVHSAPTTKTCRLMGISVDVTERKGAEEALRRSSLEIEHLKDRLQKESDYLKAEMKVTQSHGVIVGESQAMKSVLHLVEQVAPAPSSVLVMGETGTGKELIAQAIHDLSPRKRFVMVKVNCAALPSALVESELFGRERGAYTGALTRQAGRFEIADGSTIFLDEVGELSSEVQAKLLRVLQEGQFERLGSSKPFKVDVRIIAATNRDLAAETRKGRFREDLFYRLNVFPIRIPPLRERPEDVPILVWRFIAEFCSRMGKTITKVPQKVMEALQRYSWPGNVRELRNLIEHSVIISQSETLRTPPIADPAQISEEVQTLVETEREHILRTLELTRWRIKGPRGAAERLGIKPSTLYSRMEKLGIPTRRQKDQARS